MMKQSTFDENYPLPLVLEPDSGDSDPKELVAWIQTNGEQLMSSLHDHGAVLFRGFHVSSPGAFKRLVKKVGTGFMDYVDGNSPRTRLSSGVYTSTEYPAKYFISLHNELSYSLNWPGRLFFCCITAPQKDGETVLVDSRRLLAALDDDVVEAFRAKGVLYIRNLHGGEGFGPSWQDTFETDQRDEVESLFDAQQAEFRWQGDGSLRISHRRPALQKHHSTGEEVWFNQADQFHPSTHPKEVYESLISLYSSEEEMPQNVSFGDGSPIPVEALDHIREVTRDLTVAFPWHQGDLLMVDNMLAAHGRAPFEGPRKILVSMCDTLNDEIC